MTRKIFFFKNHTENEAERVVSDHFLYFRNVLYVVKASGPHFSFKIFR